MKELTKESKADIWMNCTFKEMNENGNYQQCSTKVLKKNIDKNNQNNNYCTFHQEFVDLINKKRIAEANKKLIENINKELEIVYNAIIFENGLNNYDENYCIGIIKYFQNKLNNGDFND